AGVHVRDLALVEDDAPHELDVEVAEPDRPHAGLAGEGERLDEQVVQVLAARGALAKGQGAPAELLVREPLELRLQGADLGRHLQVVADVAGVGVDQPGEYVLHGTTGSITVRPPSGRRKHTLTMPVPSSRKT